MDKMIICPFHEDTYPSLEINFQTNVAYCFGCQTRLCTDIKKRRAINGQ